MKIKQKYHSRQTRMGLTFVTPAVVLLFVFLILPALMSLIFSFTDFYVLTPDAMSFVGLDNYKTLLSDKLFWKCLKNTAYFTFTIVPIEAVMALGLAILVNRKMFGRTFFRIAYFAPVIASLTVVSIFCTTQMMDFLMLY